MKVVSRWWMSSNLETNARICEQWYWTALFLYGKSIDTLKDTHHEEIFLSFLEFIRGKLCIFIMVSKKVTTATLKDTPHPPIISSYEERINWRKVMNRKRIWIWEALETKTWDYNKGLLYLPHPHPLSPMRQWGAMMSYGYRDLFMSSKYTSWAQCCLRGGWKGGLMLKMHTTKFVMELLFKCHKKPRRKNNRNMRKST